MEVYAELKVNDGKTGELLERTSVFTQCEKCKTLEVFDENHGESIREYLENKLVYNYAGRNVVRRLDFVELADELKESDEEEDEDTDE